jgi:hypothetical protein
VISVDDQTTTHPRQTIQQTHSGSGDDSPLPSGKQAIPKSTFYFLFFCVCVRGKTQLSGVKFDVFCGCGDENDYFSHF